MVTEAMKLKILEEEEKLLLRRKTMTNLDNLLKIRDIALPTRVCYSQSYGFSLEKNSLEKL